MGRCSISKHFRYANVAFIVSTLQKVTSLLIEMSHSWGASRDNFIQHIFTINQDQDQGDFNDHFEFTGSGKCSERCLWLRVLESVSISG